jgi:polysaccharide biosynthesis transport protein
LESRQAPDQQDIRAYLGVLNRRKWTIGLVSVVVIALALGYSFAKTSVYTASAQVLIPAQSATSALAPAVDQQAPAAANLERSLSDAQQFADGNQTQAAAEAILHQKTAISVGASSTADVLTFTAKNTSPAEAAATANAYANGFITANRSNQVEQYASQVTALQKSIAKLQATANSEPAGSQQQVTAQSSISTLTQSLQSLQAASELVAESGPTIVDVATAPGSPSSPKTARNGVLALVVGILLGIALAFLRDHLDDKIKSKSDVEENSGDRPVVGAVPLVESWRKRVGPHVALMEDTNSPVSEAYRTLRTSIQFLGIDEQQRVIGITSSIPDEGKSTATANLAVSFARAGQRVVVASFDFRRPRLHQFFGLDNHVGATSVLLGESTLRDALRTIPGEANLQVLPSGPVPPNPAEILSLDRVRKLINVLAANADVILLDCPPVLPVTDSLLISRLCDTMLVIAVAETTKKSDLRRTYEMLSQVKAPVRGTIVNRIPQNHIDSDYGYGYGYGYGYASETEADPSSNGETASSTKSNGDRGTPSARRLLVDRLSTAQATGHGNPSELQETDTLDDFSFLNTNGKSVKEPDTAHP